MADLRSIISGLMGAHRPHHASPERKGRRTIVKVMGRRQAVQHIKDMRSLAKVEALIERIAIEKAEVRRA